LSQSLAVAHVLELASHHFIVYPSIRPEIHRRIPAINALNLPPIPHGKHFATLPQTGVST
jgi:hypothetical protein